MNLVVGRMKLVFFILLMLPIASNITFSKNLIYVSLTNTSKNGNGTKETPFTSFEEAFQRALDYKGRDTVFIQFLPGIHYLDRTIEILKNPEVPIVIQGDMNDKTILSGAITSKFSRKSNLYWESNIPIAQKYGLKVEQLYVNDQRAIRARTPDSGFFFIKDIDETILYKGEKLNQSYAVQRFTVEEKELKGLKSIAFQDINNVVATFFHKWNITRRYISHVSPDSGYVFCNGLSLRNWHSIKKGNRFFLENYKSALTVAGEWFLDGKGKLYYIPRKNDIFDQTRIFLPILSTLLRIKGTESSPINNIHIRNISFQHSAYLMPRTGNSPFQAAANIDAAIQLDYAQNITFDNCEIKHTGNYAIWFNKACRNCVLNHSYLYDLGAGGIKIGEYDYYALKKNVTSNIVISNNIIQETGKVLPCGVGVSIFHSSNNRIVHNEISNLLYSGISVGWKWGYGKSFAVNNEIAYNHIHHIGWGKLSDMGAVYTLGESPGTHIHHNVIHDVYSYDYGGWGLYADEGSSNILFEKNLVYACKSGGFHQHFGKNNIVKNNIFAFGIKQQLQLTREEPHRSFSFISNIIVADCGTMIKGPWKNSNIIMSKNCFWSLETDSISQSKKKNFIQWLKKNDASSIFENPSFKDPYNGNFNLKNAKLVKEIGFSTFDYKSAGVYGDDNWKQKAKMKKEDIESFKRIVLSRETNSGLYYVKR